MKTKFKFAHSADWHLLEIQYGRRDRAEDFYQAAAEVINQAANRGAQALVVVGDILNKPVMSAGLFSILNRINALLVERSLVMLVVTGNHDAGDPDWFTEFAKSNDSRIHPLDDNGWTHPSGFSARGVNFTGPESMLEKIRALPPASVLAAHLAVDSVASNSPSAASVPHDALPKELFPYIACGDIHIPAISTYSTVVGYTTIAMPGSIDITQNGEPLQKSFYLVTMECEPEYRSTVLEVETVNIVNSKPVIPIHIAKESDMDSAIARLRAAAGRDPIVFIRFNPEVADVRSRINAILAGTNAIVRAAAYDTDMRAPVMGRAAATQHKSATLMEALNALCPAGSRVHDLAAACLVNPQSVDALLDAYIEKQSLLSAS
jgi:hypothetical protein